MADDSGEDGSMIGEHEPQRTRVLLLLLCVLGSEEEVTV